MKNTDELHTNAPKQETMGPASDLDSKHPYDSEKLYPGDSVDQHKKLEHANMFLNEAALKQQNENL
ncbi:hypothetical protein [Bacillus sp. 165]|uniref:hypothetical protein n=1 Tax=Bacillus sp. 165 TaxID=1529117 RepID=UPI001ADB20E7|nr:hypothetical protein [Bacillus sp. 165]MBO9128408.1 hypothetical protein [Bacillus sp. 165]